MPRKKTKKISVTVKDQAPPARTQAKPVQPARKLLDERILPKPKSRLTRIIGAAVILGFASGLAMVAYLMYSQNPAQNPDYEPQIVVPETQSPEEATSTAATTNGPADQAAAVPIVIRYVKILATPTGFLNVRSGPAASYRKIGEAKPGESFEFVSEDAASGWFEVKLAGGTGWVTKKYASLQ